jgi:methyltransferase-like protein/trans-aconitate methyltransferase
MTPRYTPAVNDAYDEVPYMSRAFAATHPASLAVMGTLFGLQPTPPSRARVLELGCAAGGNLVPMAHGNPGAEFVGVDRNAKGIEVGQARIQTLGLTNISLHTADLLDLPDLGQFDYIVAHGVYSWVPAQVQRALLDACKKRLTPHGIAYISYNTMPGWANRTALREMALFHAGEHPALSDRLGQTRALVQLVQQATPQDHPHFSAMPDWYVIHEHLGENNEALWFHEFVRRAGVAGLQFLGEAELRDMVAGDLPEDIRAQVEALGSDQLRLEQYLDFVRHRTFRRTLLVHDDVTIDRDIALDRIDDLYVGGALATQPSDPTVPSVAPEATEQDPVAAATWDVLQHSLPSGLPFTELLERVVAQTSGTATERHDDVANHVFSALLQGSVHLSASPMEAAPPSASPVAYAIARDEVSRGETWVTNRRHQGVQLDPYMVTVLPLLDGTRSTADIIERLADAATTHVFELLDLDHTPVTDRAYAVGVLTEGWPRALDVLAYYALLD